MSILTKICVVVLLVLILLACPVFITQATVAPNFRHAYQQEVNRGKSFQMEARQEKLAHSKTIVERDQAIEARNKTIADTQIEIARLMSNLAAWQTKSSAQENNLTGLKAEMARLAAASEAANARNDMLAAQLDQMRASIDKLTEEKIRVTDLLKQTDIEKTRVDQMARDLQERISALEEENDQLRRSGAVAKTEKGQEAPSAAGEAITGTVESVKDNLASINIGSAKGIKPNMKLTVYRGDKFVAFLRIEDVEVGKAAGIIVDRRLDPVQGDKVTTSLQNY